MNPVFGLGLSALLATAWPAAGLADVAQARQGLAQARAAAGTVPAPALIRDYLQPALDQARAAGDASLEREISLELAARYRATGRFRDALELLDSLADGSVETLRERALALRGLGQPEAALAANRQALDAVAAAGQPLAEARLLNDRGLLLAERGDGAAASDHFAAAARLAPGDPGLELAIALNRARLALETGDVPALQAGVDEVRSALGPGLPPRVAARAHLSLGVLYRRANRELGLPAAWRALAHGEFQAAAALAAQLEDALLASWAQGYTAELYADEKRHAEALALARRAAFAARSVNADHALYRWQWRAARSLVELDDRAGAALAYQQAIDTLGRLQADLLGGSDRSYRELAAPVFFEFADLRLRQSAALPDGPDKVARLREVREVIERVKVAEVQDYFSDQCVQGEQGEQDATELDLLAEGAAILYPILLPDRLELLVSLPGGLRQFTVPVGSARLTAEVREFRRHIERYDQRLDYLAHARTLHDWLIGPLATALTASGVETLVIVPDGPLRTIPLAALHDGERFLVERYALATTPGLTLTRPGPLDRASVQLLAGGVTEAVQGFSGLPNVGRELDSISRAFPAQTLRDQAFVVDAVERRIAEGDQAIVHIATHGQFDSDHTQSFLLAYDDKLTMDRLQSTIASRRHQSEPLELLVLSACQTAAGDDRAALGLAGVALRAGARSALASLWFVNDASTARMVEDFYRELGDASNSKAEALRQAQLGLIRDPQFGHPAYWAPFLLIGNWL